MAALESLKSRRGYIFTVSTFFLMGLVLFLAIFFASRVEKIDITGPKLAMLYDDLRADIADLVDLEIEVKRDYADNETLVTFTDRMPDPMADYRVQNYKTYIEANYSKWVGRQLDSREGSLAAADISLDLTNASFPINPFGYNYAYDNLSKNELFIYPDNRSPSLIGGLINITLDKNVTNMTQNVSQGNTSIRLYITFWNNQTSEEQADVSDNDLSSWKIETLDGNITLDYGRSGAGGGFRNGVMHLQVDGNITIGVETTLWFNGTEIVNVGSQFTSEIMDILGKAWLIRPLYLFKE